MLVILDDYVSVPKDNVDGIIVKKNDCVVWFKRPLKHDFNGEEGQYYNYVMHMDTPEQAIIKKKCLTKFINYDLYNTPVTYPKKPHENNKNSKD